MSKEIEELIDAENWRGARQLIRHALRKEPGSHWLLTRLGLTYYEERNYKKALFYDSQALGLAPCCPLVLWDYAGTLDMLGRSKEAIAIYRKLVKQGEDKIAYGECGEGLAWARGVIADCLYRIAKCYEEQKRPKKALSYYEQHLKRREPGSRSIYPINEVKRQMKEVGSRKDAV